MAVILRSKETSQSGDRAAETPRVTLDGGSVCFLERVILFISLFSLSFHRKFIVQLEIMMVILYQALPANVCIIISYNQRNAKKKGGAISTIFG